MNVEEMSITLKKCTLFFLLRLPLLGKPVTYGTFEFEAKYFELRFGRRTFRKEYKKECTRVGICLKWLFDKYGSGPATDTSSK